jgi:hypothetical protein
MAVQSAPVTSVAGVAGHERQRRDVPVTLDRETGVPLKGNNDEQD